MPKIKNPENIKKAKQEILSGCFSVFATKGYKGISIRTLASELNCTTGTLYHYFGSKEEIFIEMIRFMTEKDITQGIQEVSQVENLREKLEVLFNFVFKKKKYFRELIYITNECVRDKKQFKEEAKILRECFHSYQSNINKHLGLKSEKVSFYIMSIITGLIIQSEILNFKDKFTIDLILDFHRKIIDPLNH